MSTLCYLLDEHVPIIIKVHLERSEPTLDVYHIGTDIVPQKGTPDPDILLWIETHGCMLVTNNRSTMPVHLRAHLDQGRHVPGIVMLPKRKGNIGAILDDLLLIWGASLPDEFQDQIIYLPLRR